MNLLAKDILMGEQQLAHLLYEAVHLLIHLASFFL